MRFRFIFLQKNWLRYSFEVIRSLVVSKTYRFCSLWKLCPILHSINNLQLWLECGRFASGSEVGPQAGDAHRLARPNVLPLAHVCGVERSDRIPRHQSHQAQRAHRHRLQVREAHQDDSLKCRATSQKWKAPQHLPVVIFPFAVLFIRARGWWWELNVTDAAGRNLFFWSGNWSCDLILPLSLLRIFNEIL